MDKDLVQGQLGEKVNYDVALKDGKFHIEIKADLGDAKAGMVIELDAIKFAEKLAAKSENKLDDAFVAMVKGALV